MSEAKYKFQNCENNEGLCADETCVEGVDNCRIGDKDVIIAELVEALDEGMNVLADIAGEEDFKGWNDTIAKMSKALAKAKGES